MCELNIKAGKKIHGQTTFLVCLVSDEGYYTIKYRFRAVLLRNSHLILNKFKCNLKTLYTDASSCYHTPKILISDFINLRENEE